MRPRACKLHLWRCWRSGQLGRTVQSYGWCGVRGFGWQVGFGIWLWDYWRLEFEVNWFKSIENKYVVCHSNHLIKYTIFYAEIYMKTGVSWTFVNYLKKITVLNYMIINNSRILSYMNEEVGHRLILQL